MGIAFQIKDDLFDYEKNLKTGKPSGIDIKESKMTLPLIYSLSKAQNSDKKKIINIIKNYNTDAKKVAEVISFVNASGGIDYAKKRMCDFQQKSFEILSSFPDNIFKESLMKLVRFTTERDN